MSDSSFKLPLLAGRKKLPALPGQQKGVQYGVIWDACPIPERGSCYVVRFESSSTVSILAYVDNRGGVFHVDHPITLAPAGEPDLAAVPDSNGHEGTLYVKDAHAALQPHGRYHGAFSGLMREVAYTETAGVTGVDAAYNGSELLGYCVQTEPAGFGGAISMMVGVSTDGTVTGVSILEHNETPGVGTNAMTEDFLAQYTGRTGTLTVKTGADTDIQHITGATVTSAAVTDGVNIALAFIAEGGVN